MIDAVGLVKQHDCIVEDKQRSKQVSCEESFNVLAVSVSVVHTYYRDTTCYVMSGEFKHIAE